MPHFDIIKQCDVANTFRVSKIQADYDVKPEHSVEHFTGDIVFPEKWHIGVIVGGSGTGKTTIARELFKNSYVRKYEYNAMSVVDDMPNVNIKEIEKVFYTVGFGSVPSWLKPYRVLSNGEQMRVDLARALLENDTICFDEFTSVVDRNVARTTCVAINKAIKKTGKQFVAVTCHYDVLDWLEPDWIFDTNTMTQNFQLARDKNNAILSNNAGVTSGANLDVIII